MLDYNIEKWAKEKFRYSGDCKRNDNPNIVPDSVYKSRLERLPHIMEMPYNSTIRAYIDLYSLKKRRPMEYMLGIGQYYFPMFEEELARQGIPLELKYLPVIESALNPTAISPAGAAGLWQFMVATGRAYGLEINSLIDERLDPEKSTKAAARYLKDLYGIYGDWHLVIAAYNCGPGNVSKARRRSGVENADYWTIYPYLPAETRGYVPIFIGANYVFEYSKEHNLCPLDPSLPAVTDTILIRERIHLQQIASVLNIQKEELTALNPQYKQSIIPASIEKPYSLRLPIKYIDPFVEQYDSIVAYHADELINNRRSQIEAAKHVAPVVSGGKVKYHTVKSGQTISTIASRYGVSVSNLKRWNGLKSSKIRAGQKLKIMK
jgi:membrane-bound lytic murein transglycosylase D